MAHQRQSSVTNEAMDVMRRHSARFGGGGALIPAPDQQQQQAANMPPEMLEFEAKTELSGLSAQKDALMKSWEKIDTEKNGDVELDEFKEAMREMEVELSDEDLDKIFTYMDTEEAGAIDMNEYSSFLTMRFDSVELQRLQNQILSKIRGGQHTRKHSNLISQGVEDWDPFELSEEQRAMKQAMVQLVDTEKQIQTQEDALFEELKKHEEEDEDYGDPDRAAEWTHWEVASYLEEQGMPEYMTAFLQRGIDGSIFLYDLNEFTLIQDCGVKKVHIGKIIRLAEELRVKCMKELDQDVFDTATLIPPEEENSKNIIAKLKQQLREALEENVEMRKQYELEITELNKELQFHRETIEQAKADGFLESDNESGSESDIPDLETVDPPLGDEMEATLQQVQLGLRLPTEKLDLDSQPNSVMSDGDDIDAEPIGQKDASQPSAEDVASIASANSETAAETPADTEVDDDADEMNRLRSETTVVNFAEEKKEESAPPTLLSKAQTHAVLPSANARPRVGHVPKQNSLVIRGKVHHRKKSTMSRIGKPPKVGTKAWWKYLTKRAEESHSFGREERCLVWEPSEVAYWLRRVGFENYGEKFAELNVNGEVLFHDLDTTVLTSDLGVRPIHCGQLLRKVRHLKQKYGNNISVDDTVMENTYVPPEDEALGPKLAETKMLLQDKEQQFTELKEGLEKENKTLHDEVVKLEQKVQNLEDQVQELEKRPEQAEPEPEAKEEEEEQPQEEPEPMPENFNPKWPKEVQPLMLEVANTAEQDPDFAKAEKASAWSYKEVCYWLDLIDFPSYIPVFAEHHIDGEIIIKDINQSMLHEDLDVKRFHCGKIMREIRRLVAMCPETYSFAPMLEESYVPEFSAAEKMAELAEENRKQKEQIDELINRPQIEDHEMIIEKTKWEELNTKWEKLDTEHGRLTEQIDRLEIDLDAARNAAVPAQEAAAVAAQHEERLEHLRKMKEENPDFGVEANVKEWNEVEVCWWITSVGYGEYVPQFEEKKILGDILMTDMDADLLSRELMVKRIHINKILREIKELKDRVFGFEPSEFMDCHYEPGTDPLEPRAVDRFASYENDIQQLNKDLVETKELLENKTTEFNTTLEQKTALEEELEQTKQTVTAKENEIEELTKTSMKQLEEQAQEKIEELNTKIEEITTQFNTEKKEINQEHQATVTKMEEEKNTLSKEMETIKKQLTETQEKFDTITTHCEELQQIVDVIEEEKQRKAEAEAAEAKEAAEKTYEDELREKAEDDPFFCNIKKAHKWTVEEVSYWLLKIHAPDYVDAFKDNKVDGSMLLNDLTTEELKTVLEIKHYHLGKIAREIQKLKDYAQPDLEESDPVEFSFIPKKSSVDEISDLQSMNEALTAEVEQLRAEMEDLARAQAAAEASAADLVKKSAVAAPDIPAPAMQSQLSIEKDDSKVDPGSAEKIAELEREIRRLVDSKIDLVKNTAEELENLRVACRVLSREYEILSGTPFGTFSKDPMGNIFGAMGLELKRTPQLPPPPRRGRGYRR